MVAPVLSCGVLIFRPAQPDGREYLFLRLFRNLDLPKGRMEAGEDEMTCALRELREETTIGAQDIRLRDGFRHVISYRISTAGGRAEKIVTVFLAELVRPVAIRLSEHHAALWIPARDSERLNPRWHALVGEAERFLG